ncbi:heterokaryon incompatibility protein-domain-containing protein [Fusarium flagelliforme]|uniref:heterokaryon incompatibility protein-domain-containing protein n=1 Tax=Fusarium flagelliforme TaxID=2675880 RepID=UPI001E8DE7ED|nr:heterokaryon incompatibility protein-domain-containing protein [Fusarium flagelliforme]KAH7174602.1 heterokaryon incompatibility protein-domain-containing protein [Fusarium flagelliforme]
MDNHESHIKKLGGEGDEGELQSVCPCCFNLNALLVDEDDNDDVRIDQSELVVSIRRDDEQMRHAADGGCESCRFMLKAMEYYNLLPPKAPKNTHQDTSAALGPSMDLGLSWKGNLRLRLRLPIGPGNPEISFGNPARSQTFLQLYGDEAQGDSLKHIKPLPDICDDHLSKQGLSFINSCLKMCKENHKHCKQNDTNLPTRVLDIGVSEDSHVRLIETIDKEAEKYIALSYCWGSNPSIRTMAENIEEMKSGVTLERLPAAYVDAIALTRQLGVRYIWIDALCIIQDSQADWEKECSKMAETYTNAYLTIAAASSTSVTSHFLKPRLETPPQAPHYNRQVFKTAVTGNNGKGLVSVKARLMQATGAHWQWQDTQNDQQPLVEPLTQRGWTLQEKILSTRLLSLSASEMVWTCKERIACECGSRLNHQREFGGTPLSQISRRSEAFNFWHKIVENYAKRKLTRSEDKLPAISAIAAIVQKKIGSDYIAGLWADNIELDLLWRRPASTAVQSASSCYIAPSFSWASITGEIDYLCFRNGKWPYEKAANVLEVTSETGPDAPLGRVMKSKLVVQGPIATGYVERQGPHGWFVVRLGSTRLFFFPDTVLSTTDTTIANGGSEVSVCRRSHEHGREELRQTLQRLDPKGKSKSEYDGTTRIRCWVLRLGAYSIGKRRQKDHEWLVLGRSATQTEEPECFERVGWGSMKNHNEEERVFAQESTSIITIV